MGEKVEGQRAWEKVGVVMSQGEYAELHSLKEKLKSGTKLTFEEETRLFNLEQRLRSIAHTK